MVWEEVPLEEFARRVEISNAREEGEEIGMAKGILTVVRNMLARNMPIRDIAELTGMKERDIAGLAGA